MERPKKNARKTLKKCICVKRTRETLAPNATAADRDLNRQALTSNARGLCVSYGGETNRRRCVVRPQTQARCGGVAASHLDFRAPKRKRARGAPFALQPRITSAACDPKPKPAAATAFSKSIGFSGAEKKKSATCAFRAQRAAFAHQPRSLRSRDYTPRSAVPARVCGARTKNKGLSLLLSFDFWLAGN